MVLSWSDCSSASSLPWSSSIEFTIHLVVRCRRRAMMPCSSMLYNSCSPSVATRRRCNMLVLPPPSTTARTSLRTYHRLHSPASPQPRHPCQFALADHRHVIWLSLASNKVRNLDGFVIIYECALYALWFWHIGCQEQHVTLSQ